MHADRPGLDAGSECPEKDRAHHEGESDTAADRGSSKALQGDHQGNGRGAEKSNGLGGEDEAHRRFPSAARSFGHSLSKSGVRVPVPIID